jgi:murein DD-endopeptidase MepM/ murein hydrolase activator NlpD
VKKASLSAAFAASLSLGSMPVCQAAEGAPVDEARAAEERVLYGADDDARFLAYQPFTREISASVVVKASLDQALADSSVLFEARVAQEQLLGSADGEARFLAYQPFTREIASSVVVSASLERALADSGVPAATLLEALRAFSATVNLERDVKRGDRLYFRYEQAFTAEGAPMGVGRVMWAELTLASRGPVAIHRFHTHDKVDRLWFTNGLAATPPALRMPLDIVSVSSGFGLRADPFDQPPPLAIGKAAPMGGPLRSKPLPPGLPTGGTSGNGGLVNMATPLGASLGLAPYAGFGAAAPKASQALFMHEGIDLVAPAGTPVYAAADGVVVGAAPNGRYGNWIRIEHGDKLATVYGHLMAFAPGIEPGESVVRGELIGFVGSTGRSTGAHLHFEVLDNGKAVNPINHPELKAMQLRGLDMDRFRKQVARSLEERTRESKVASAGL